MDKDLLRNQLFEKYFEIEDGIFAIDLVDKLSFIKTYHFKTVDKCLVFDIINSS